MPNIKQHSINGKVYTKAVDLACDLWNDPKVVNETTTQKAVRLNRTQEDVNHVYTLFRGGSAAPKAAVAAKGAKPRKGKVAAQGDLRSLDANAGMVATIVAAVLAAQAKG